MQIDIDKTVEEIFLREVKKSKKSPADVLNKLLLEYVEDLIDYRSGIEGYQRYLASEDKGTTLEDLKKELQLEDE